MTNKEIKCPICESKELIKRGVIKTESKGDRQRYGCKKCGKRFIPDEPFFRMSNTYPYKQLSFCHGFSF